MNGKETAKSLKKSAKFTRSGLNALLNTQLKALIYPASLLLFVGCQQSPSQQEASNPNIVASSDLKSIIESYKAPIAFWPPMELDEGVEVQELAPISSLQKTKPDPEIVELGKQLFFDPRLSSSGQIACASCHDPELGWGDGRRHSYGHNRKRGNRNAMTIVNASFFEEHFWDGRAKGLKDQALQPVKNPIEMHETLENMVKKLNENLGYSLAFYDLYGVEKIEEDVVADAIATFESTIVSKTSRFDRFMLGKYDKMNDEEIHGLHLYRTKARCIQCHSGALMSDGKFHNIGLSYFGRKFQDLGRYNVTNNREDMGAFRTPSLRDVAYTGPYMHNGFFPHLRGVINMYDHGMTFRAKAKPNGPILDPLIKPLDLSKKEKKALEAFLLAASKKPIRIRPPHLPLD